MNDDVLFLVYQLVKKSTASLNDAANNTVVGGHFLILQSDLSEFELIIVFRVNLCQLSEFHW